MEPNILIIISGKIGSGKTTLAHALATTLDYAAISFSDEVRSEAKKRGLRETREDLQMVGEDLVTNHAREFCLAVLARGRALERRGLVVDGLRHVEILDILRRLVAPQKVVHVHIASPDEVAASRALVRGRKGDSKAPSQLHSTEIQVERLLPNQADLCVDGTIAPELLVKLITDEIDLS